MREMLIDAVEPHALEAVHEACLGSLGRIPLAPGVAREQPADLDLHRIGAPVGVVVEADLPDQPAGRLLLDRPLAEPVAFPVADQLANRATRLDVREHRDHGRCRALRPVAQPGAEVAHDVVVPKQLGVGSRVLLAPGTEPQARRLDRRCGRPRRRAESYCWHILEVGPV